MGREIKFRAWDGDELTAIDSLYFFEECGIHEINSDGVAVGVFDSFNLMQYTGLKDKNGVEIYEGDIVKRDSLSQLLTVHWSTSEGLWGFYDQTGSCYIFDTIRDYEYEVIGNIHQNPELLEK